MGMNLLSLAAQAPTRRRVGGHPLGGLLPLLVALTVLPAGAQQAAPPRQSPGQQSVDAWNDLNKRQNEGDAKALREAEQLRESDRVRRQADDRRKSQIVQEKEREVMERPKQLLGRLLQLTDSLKLTADHRVLAEATLQAARDHAAALWPAWQEQAVAVITAGAPKAAVDVERVALQLSVRALNETALWLADAEPHASDTVWIEALRREGLCQGLAGTDPAARLAALIEALPADQRGIAWAGEAARLSRWGQETRAVLPPAERTLEDSLALALKPPFQARTLAGMPATLRAAVETGDGKLAAQPPAVRCELLRWWSQEQVRAKRLTSRQAMLAWRTALAPRSTDFLLTEQPRSGPAAFDAQGFPKLARQLELSGRVVVQQEVDAGGKVLSSFIQRRELRAEALGPLPPIALEQELDEATQQRVAAMPPQAPAPETVRDGSATRRVGIEWAPG